MAPSNEADLCNAVATAVAIDDRPSVLRFPRGTGIGADLAAAGVGLAIAAQAVWWALPGFAMAGAGFSVIVPLAYGAGGRVPGVSPGAGVATVTGIGYVGFLLGPPLIGFTSHTFSMRAGLGTIALASLVATSLAGFVAPTGESGR
jgi:hypothetical protein